MNAMSSPPRDYSLYALLATNVLIIALAVLQRWNFLDVLMVYWFQSVIIGIFAVVTMVTGPLPPGNSGADGVEINGRAVDTAKPGARFILPVFFCVHYGLFHLVYLVFILVFLSMSKDSLDLPGIFLSVLLFGATHGYSWWLTRKVPQDPNKVFNAPYGRIVPMHLTIILAGFLLAALPAQAGPLLILSLMALKTGVDAREHIRKRNALVWDGVNRFEPLE